MSSTPCLRGRISSPLEAGPSISDGHHLPSPVNEAFEYASKRLGRKVGHITLLVVRKDYQLPTSPITSPTFPPGSVPASTVATLSRPAFPTTSRLGALKQLVRQNFSGDAQIRERILHVHLDQFRNDTASPAFSEASAASAASASTVSSVSTSDSTFSHRVRWPTTPTAYESVPVTPATPFTVMSSLSGADGNSAVSQSSVRDSTRFGLRLVYAHPLSPREEKALSQVLEKSARKFKLDPRWLSQAVSPSTLGLPADLVLKSTAQNEVLFSSEHLTLLSLDHLYTFRTALQAYARSNVLCRLEDAVDDLRRLFLANGRRPVRKSALLAAYRWLDPISDASLTEVCRMYERAYGGKERESGVKNDIDPAPAWPLLEGDVNATDAEPLSTKRMGMLAPGPRPAEGPKPPPQESGQRTETHILDLVDALDKEIVVSGSTDIGLDDGSQLDEYEAWYREMHDGEAAVEIHPLRSHPATITPAVTEIPHPPPSPPPDPPTTATFPTDWPQSDDLQSDDAPRVEMQRTTPKLRPAPPGKSPALKLQTTFDKPVGNGGKQSANMKQQHLTEQGHGEHEEEEQLTARPRSAIKSFADVRWSFDDNIDSNNGMSIDGMLHGDHRHPDDDGDGSRKPQHHQQQPEERVGPMTPNGYDDISPITRGEWGFLMFGKGKTAKVETC
ncbi:uncharacterized protein B0T15DRAFT_294680 [Chaetomium strumarium]|uniref:DUF7582 domain-containing protein n=1 Tax=Chaetomium strumarium TaxID=1170767 RepID=A0AAJ0GLL5_9PEZI|nr:hypothetical protein B0T15DRAFT_294680 [Chaetomium strumarium]